MLFKSLLANAISIPFCFTLISYPVFSQNASCLDSLEGKYALQFQINENFRLLSFQGTTLSGKYNFCSRNAVRVGLSVDFANQESDLSEMRLDIAVSSSAKSNLDAFGIMINTQYIHYIPSADEVAFYLGCGPFVGFNNTTNELQGNPIDSDYSRKETVENFSAGVDLILGVEWIFFKNMSLSGEYGIEFNYNSSTHNSEDNYVKRETSNKNFRITRGDINFGISVYF